MSHYCATSMYVGRAAKLLELNKDALFTITLPMTLQKLKIITTTVEC